MKKTCLCVGIIQQTKHYKEPFGIVYKKVQIIRTA